MALKEVLASQIGVALSAVWIHGRNAEGQGIKVGISGKATV